MIVSWNWLRQYVALDMPVEELTRRLMLAGLNHESTAKIGDDWMIDLEVTSNRPDCLGHLGIAREVAVLWNQPLTIPAAQSAEAVNTAAKLTSVIVESPKLCPRYTARVIQGVKIGPSPAWLRDRLSVIGIAAINNVVDITNYVLMECGQPLHAFDFDRLAGRRIIVRDAQRGEKFTAINHKVYDLEPGMCVIADERQPVALGGVMGGADTEVSLQSKNVLLEAALFDPVSIRSTARRLNLHSPSSYRFERGLDPEGVDWASRRACEIILETAGGELAAGAVDVGAATLPRAPIVLRLAQLKRILGIDIPAARVREILVALGNQVRRADEREIEVVPPSWRRDLTREIDLVEEAARIHGYDQIPEDVSVPMVPSTRTVEDRILTTVRHVLTAAGIDEALTPSIVEDSLSEAFSPWTSAPPLRAQMPLLRGAHNLRRSLVPSLLAARRTNEAIGNARIELFEIARVYLPQSDGLPTEELMLAITSGSDHGGSGYSTLKGVLESILAALKSSGQLTIEAAGHDLLDARHAGQFKLDGQLLGFIGEVSEAGRKAFELRGATAVAELRISVLAAAARLVPQYKPLSAFPAVSRDLNFVVDEPVVWSDLADCVRGSAGPLLEELNYRETYRDPQRLGPGKKSLLLSFTLRSPSATLSNDEADQVRDRVVAACRQRLGAELRA